jgi:signal transduction histidine kinase
MRAFSLTLIVVTLLACAVSTCVAGEQQPKRVLIFHSFGPDFGDLYSEKLRTELDQEMPGRLDLYEEWLVSARFSTPHEDTALVNYLRSLFADHPLDLIITLGAPAAEFIRHHRQTLFPRVPEVLADVEERKVESASPPAEESAVPIAVSFPVIADGILRVLPKTTTLAVVIGNSAIENYWVGQIRNSMRPFEGRMSVTFLNEMSFDQVLKRVAALPANSAIFYVLLSRSVPGIPEDESIALAKLHSAADAPIFSYTDAYLGKGIVGGSLISSQEQIKKIVSVSARILAGERASGITTPALQFASPQYDWRELKRWHIRDSALPPGSSIRFMPVSGWQRYRWQIASAGLFILLQMALILGLLYERRGRMSAEATSRTHFVELARMNRLSAAGELSASIAHELGQPLGAILRNSEAADLILNSPAPDIAELREIMHDIKRDDHRAAEVIARLRTSLKRAPIEPQDLDLNDQIREVFDFLSYRALASRITLSARLAQPAPQVRGDRVQLQQVILNLVLNAMDAMTAEQDTGFGRRRIVGRTAVLNSRFAEVSIEDSGPGIPPGKEREVFRPFFTTKESGMGMGLSIARTIVENYGGQIAAENLAQGGAVFRFTLPLVVGQPDGETTGFEGTVTQHAGGARLVEPESGVSTDLSRSAYAGQIMSETMAPPRRSRAMPQAPGRAP